VKKGVMKEFFSVGGFLLRKGYICYILEEFKTLETGKKREKIGR